MLKLIALCAIIGASWAETTTMAPMMTTTSENTFLFDQRYHEVVMVRGDACFFHRLNQDERFDAQDASGLKAIEDKILAAEQRLEDFGTETQHNLYYFSYSHEIRTACRGKETYKISGA